MTQLKSETERLVNLTNDLLTLSQLEDAQPGDAPARVPVDLVAVVRGTVQGIEALATAKQQQVTAEASDEVVVQGDEAALGTLVRNLLDNAIRYTDEGGHVTVQVRTAGGPGDETFAVLSVADDGMGIPIADQSRIFERFYRVEKARSRETGGTGLGLSIVKHIAESHGGQVEVRSVVGVGSTFTVRLPKS